MMVRKHRPNADIGLGYLLENFMANLKVVKPHQNRIDPDLFQKRIHAEAERRSAFVRGMGGSLVGYCDGYADGFEQAAQWLLGQLSDPLAVEYRPASGMSFSKEYYKGRSKERRRILEWFERIAVKTEVPQTEAAQPPSTSHT